MPRAATAVYVCFFMCTQVSWSPGLSDVLQQVEANFAHLKQQGSSKEDFIKLVRSQVSGNEPYSSSFFLMFVLLQHVLQESSDIDSKQRHEPNGSERDIFPLAATPPSAVQAKHAQRVCCVCSRPA